MLNRKLRLAALALLVAVWISSTAGANALSLYLVPTVSGGSVTVDIVVSGLGAGVPPSIGSFDITLSYPSAVLQAVGVTFGTGLGTPAQTVTSQSADAGAGTWQVVSVSLLSEAALDALQGSTVVLATLEFLVLEAGNVSLDVVAQMVTDAAGPPSLLPFDSVDGASFPVPEPGSLALLIGAASLAVRGNRRASSRS